MMKRLSSFIGAIQLFSGILALSIFQFGASEMELLFSFHNNFFIQTGIGAVSAIFILSGLLLLI